MRRMLMNTGSVLLAASTLAAVTTFSASAQDAPTIAGNVALVSDYRFRGVSLSDEAIAVQGGFDLATASGFYVGTWGSSIDEVGGSELELDLYGGYRTEVGMFTLDGGVLGYFYPGAEDLEYYEIYGKAGTSLGMLSLTGGVNFAPEQDNLGDDDNMYYFLDGALPLGDSAFTVTGHLGYEDGVLASFFDDAGEDSKTDWSIGIGTNALGVDWGLSYVDTSEDGDDTEGTAVLSIKKAL